MQGCPKFCSTRVEDIWNHLFYGEFAISIHLITIKTSCKAYPRATGYTHISSPTNPWAPLKFDPKFLEECVWYLLDIYFLGPSDWTLPVLSPADLSVLRWCYKHARELARRMKSFRGEIPTRHPKFCSKSSVSGVSNGVLCTMSCNGTSYAVPTKSTASIVRSASGPFAIDSPKIVYSKEDDRAIDEYIRATGERDVDPLFSIYWNSFRLP